VNEKTLRERNFGLLYGERGLPHDHWDISMTKLKTAFLL
jgi:hypothetical protein